MKKDTIRKRQRESRKKKIAPSTFTQPTTNTTAHAPARTLPPAITPMLNVLTTTGPVLTTPRSRFPVPPVGPLMRPMQTYFSYLPIPALPATPSPPPLSTTTPPTLSQCRDDQPFGPTVAKRSISGGLDALSRAPLSVPPTRSANASLDKVITFCQGVALPSIIHSGSAILHVVGVGFVFP